MSHITLKPTSWRWKALDTPSDPRADLALGTWRPCAQFPTEIHLEHLRAGLIPHPYKGRNEHEIQWISEKDWLFSAVVDVDRAALEGRSGAELVFESLDTFVTVWWNSEVILEGSNHFLERKVPLDIAKIREKNELLLHFRPPWPVAKALEAEHGKLVGGSCNLGDPARLYIRKAQYHARWDWGPEIMCMGPDRPIQLHLFQQRLSEVWTKASVDEELRPSLEVDIASVGGTAPVRCSLKGLDGTEVHSETVQTGKACVAWDLAGKVDLWWPNGQGKATRYEFTAELLSPEGAVVDNLTRRIGFRRARLVQEPLIDQPGTSFCFEVNNKRIFAGGSNWIPTDQILPMIEEGRYRKLLALAAEGNQNMIRCWGGGVYEPDEFYDICDELGLMVWQDFQFACGVYPVLPAFLESVRAEAKCNVTRLRHHPSIVIFCGNNEDYQQIRQWNIDESLDDPLPARKIYEGILPDVVKALTAPEIAYWPGSPNKKKDSWATDDPTIGDIHQWTVWAPPSKPWQDYDILGGRFVSEFGMPAMPAVQTVDWWLDGDESERYPQSKLMAQHNKAGSYERRLATYINEEFRMTGDLETYLYQTQLNQAEALAHAYRSWRREFRGRGKEYNSGALVWQINDSWPVTSWSIVDYFLRTKPGYYAIKREMQPVTVGILRTVQKNRINDRPRQFYEFGAFQSREVTLDVWGTNDSNRVIPIQLVLTAVDLKTGWRKDLPAMDHALQPNGSTDLALSFPCPHPPLDEASDKVAPSCTVVIQAKIIAKDGGLCLAEACDWPQPYKFWQAPKAELSVQVEGQDIAVTTTAPVKGLVFSVDEDPETVSWSDNGFDLLPGDTKKITAIGLGSRPVKVAHLGSEIPHAI